jgi:hypothetical protein
MADKDKCTYEIIITSRQLDELEKAAISQGIPTSGQLIVEFIKETIKGYRNNVLKRDADLESIR